MQQLPIGKAMPVIWPASDSTVVHVTDKPFHTQSYSAVEHM